MFSYHELLCNGMEHTFIIPCQALQMDDLDKLYFASMGPELLEK